LFTDKFKKINFFLKSSGNDPSFNTNEDIFSSRWGTPYLTRDFFHLLGERMADDVLLVMAEDDGQLVGGALNLIGGDTLYGRNWGCDARRHYPNLHFEACYYQVQSLPYRNHFIQAGSGNVSAV
jgi:predicted N-acyltransferase